MSRVLEVSSRRDAPPIIRRVQRVVIDLFFFPVVKLFLWAFVTFALPVSGLLDQLVLLLVLMLTVVGITPAHQKHLAFLVFKILFA